MRHGADMDTGRLKKGKQRSGQGKKKRHQRIQKTIRGGGSHGKSTPAVWIGLWKSLSAVSELI